ncbi:MAG: hypothetical protein KatS3mg023_1517 [Armatimonadota bacterium]|nr:MAG: hypothetical protein KatS3mg023_1517 [Armatimonadota bacterium]
MELVRVVVQRRNVNGGSELNINVQTTPVGSLLAGAAVIWIGTKLFRLFRRRWWLPAGAGVALLALHQMTSARQAEKSPEETCEEE